MLLAVLTLMFSMPQAAQACTCTKLQGKYNKLTAKHAAAVAAGNTLKATILKGRIVNFVKLNWKEIPGCPPPVLPAAWCPDPDVGGGGGGGMMAAFPGGRGHAGGAINLAGDTALLGIFLRNADPTTGKTVTVRVTPDSLNPPGFNLLDTLFIVTLPPLPDTPGIILQIPIEIVALSLIGDQGLFHVTVEESDGRFWNERIVGQVTTSNVRVVPLDPIVEVPGSGIFTVGWRIINPGPGAISKSYGTFLLPDAEAFITLNDGTPYAIYNSYPLDKTVTGGTIIIPGAGPSESAGFIDIFCDMVSNELCEPTMLGCKGLEIDGGMSIVATPNTANGLFDPPISSAGRDLVGVATGGFLQITIDFGTLFVPINVPTFPGQPLEQIIDQLVFDIHNQYLFANNFPFQAAAIDNFMDIFGPPGAVIQYQSFDPGLQWEEPGCEPPGWMHPQILPGDAVQLNWIEGNTLPDQYQIQITPLGGGPPLFFGAPGGVNQFVTPPLAVGEYTWQIQAICDPFLPDVSAFSYPDTFQVGPCNEGDGPVNLASVVGASSVSLTWDPIANSTACQVEGTRTVPPGPTGKANVFGIASSGTTVPFAALGTGTTWDWRVRCACNTSPINATPFSGLDNFSIPLVRFAEGIAGMVLSPNPATDRIRMEVEATENRQTNVLLVDLSGRTVMQQNVALVPGSNLLEWDVAGFAEGLYLLRVGEGDAQRVDIMR